MRIERCGEGAETAPEGQNAPQGQAEMAPQDDAYDLPPE